MSMKASALLQCVHRMSHFKCDSSILAESHLCQANVLRGVVNSVRVDTQLIVSDRTARGQNGTGLRVQLRLQCRAFTERTTADCLMIHARGDAAALSRIPGNPVVIRVGHQAGGSCEL